MSTSSSSQSSLISVLMCTWVAQLFPIPRLHAYLRSAGNTGYNSYEELVACGTMIPVTVAVKEVTMSNIHHVSNTTQQQQPPNDAEGNHGDHVTTPPLPSPPPTALLASTLPSLVSTNNNTSGGGTSPTLHHAPFYITWVNPKLEVRDPRGGFNNMRAPLRTLAREEGFEVVASHAAMQRHGGERNAANDLAMYCGITGIQYLWNVSLETKKSGITTTMIPDDFLWQCTRTYSIEIVPTREFEDQITTIGSNFINDCRKLSSFDFRPLRNVTVIGTRFMANSVGLVKADLTPMVHLSQIGSHLFERCTSLTTVLLPEFNTDGGGDGIVTNTTSNNNNNTALTTTTTATTGIQIISEGFLYGCKALKHMDLTPLRHITTIQSEFMGHCEGLESINLSSLGSKVSNFGNADVFLQSCCALKSIALSSLSNITTIPAFFLGGCTGLASLDLSPFSNVTSIGMGFLIRCTGLTSIDLSPMSRVATVDPMFLEGCASLESVDVTVMPLVVATGRTWEFVGCTSLKSIKTAY